MEILLKYFKNLTEIQVQQFSKLQELYKDWNLKINVVSRKNIDQLYVQHVLHSLTIAKVISFKPKAKVMDVGTGGGFPGIPLAILFPETQFYLVDSIQKKINVVKEVIKAIELKNVKTFNCRVENIDDTYDFIVSRAVAQMETFVRWVHNKVCNEQQHTLKNGILYLKGGNLTDELKNFKESTVYTISNFFEEDFFETKKLVHLPLKINTIKRKMGS